MTWNIKKYVLYNIQEFVSVSNCFSLDKTGRIMVKTTHARPAIQPLALTILWPPVCLWVYCLSRPLLPSRWNPRNRRLVKRPSSLVRVDPPIPQRELFGDTKTSTTMVKVSMSRRVNMEAALWGDTYIEERCMGGLLMRDHLYRGRVYREADL